MLPTLLIQTRDEDGHEATMETVSVSCEVSDDIASIEIDVDEDAAHPERPTGVRCVTLQFLSHEWAAFRAYIDARFAKAP
jgi:hypothetical protein